MLPTWKPLHNIGEENVTVGRPTRWRLRAPNQQTGEKNMSRVFVLDAQRQPLMPCTPARARVLLRRKRAAVFRHFPRTGPKITRTVQGFSTGDMVRAVVSQGKKAGVYIGRVAVRATGSFNVRTAMGTVQSINHRYCTLIHRCDGYSYQKGGAVLPSKA